ncbi:MAG: LPXTG cell wall anchor domain-containing protein [Sphingomonas sp.]|jgi:LPXTG-motif cell wall-anchored protein|uniref:LPXTG cell wall anchor domain-containing protein n=1 Tax=Sphingomonas sp. TaxID=28214 RepID=UPI003563F0C7
MIAIPLALAAKAQVVQGFVKQLSSAGAALGIGDTATDKARKQEAANLLSGALGGDAGSLATLITNAFSGARPKPVQGLAKEALRAFAKSAGGLPVQYSEYAVKLGVPALSASAINEALSARGAGPSVPVPVNTSDLAVPATQSVTPYVLFGAILLLGGAFLLTRKRRS